MTLRAPGRASSSVWEFGTSSSTTDHKDEIDPTDTDFWFHVDGDGDGQKDTMDLGPTG